MSLNGGIDDLEIKKLSGKITKIEIDDTLTRSGAFADAKAVGDEINKIKNGHYMISKSNVEPLWDGEVTGHAEIVTSKKWTKFDFLILFVKENGGDSVFNLNYARHLLENTSSLGKIAYKVINGSTGLGIYKENDTDLWVYCPDGYTVTSVYGY